MWLDAAGRATPRPPRAATPRGSADAAEPSPGGEAKPPPGKKKRGADEGEGRLVRAEERSFGAVDARVYSRYGADCGGWAFCGPLGLLLVGYQVLLNGQALSLKAWVAALERGAGARARMVTYAAYAASTFACLCATRVLMAAGSLRGSQRVHDRLAHKVLAAPLAWFEATPTGRVLNRFASDVQTIDKDVMNEVAMLGQYVLSALGVVAVIAYTVPVAMASVAPMVALSYGLGRRYYACNRELKRLEATTRSPVYSVVSEVVGGLVTVRAFGALGRFRTKCLARLDENGAALYDLFAVNSWLVVRLRCLGALVNGCVVVYALAEAHALDGATVGLALSYSLSVTQAVTFTIKQHAQVEMSANALERADEYAKLPSERARGDFGPPPPGWPAAGAVAFEDVRLAYASAPGALALDGVSFAIGAGERLGVCGRTGAGKSSLVAALFRLVEVAGGRVVVDGVDVARLDLADLRRSLSLIPQDPTLFRGTVRSNLDPFGARDDADLRRGLATAGLEGSVDVDARVDDRGANFSAGEQQLLCLARAILRKSKVLVLDEATAQVDAAADARVQAALRTDDLAATTLICIAHRLATIVDFDKVAVLSRGALIECDAPAALLRDRGSAFSALCRATGDAALLAADGPGAATHS